MFKNVLINLTLIAVMINSLPGILNAQGSFIPDYYGDYLGQKPPGMTPEVFAEEILTGTINSAFTPDGNEMFYCDDFDGNETADIIYTRRIDNRWTVPETAPFNSEFDDNDMCVSQDGFRIIFRSWRPLPGNSVEKENSNLWYAVRTVNGWSEAKPVESENGYLKTGFPGITRDGTLYFSFRTPETIGKSDVHYSKFVNGIYSKPVNVWGSWNSEYGEGDMCVAGDGSFFIVSCWFRPDTVGGESDLYISFRKHDGTWTKLINMGKTINSELIENCPTISPDGKYFFFLRTDRKKTNTYWIDIKYLETLKSADLKN